ncbi:MAG: RNA polymerase subunit sigma [Alphaproteobacteria bacterium]|nr:RNA polymerase subunit sigma [Alphaproteobacteria bacterium]
MDVRQLDEDTYAHLRAIAARIHGERAGGAETIAPTALLHEAWGKVARGSYQSKAHFMAVAARAMRQILVDRARARRAVKHGGGLRRTTLSGVGGQESSLADVLDLDDAIERLSEMDEAAAQVAVMFTFGGMSAPEVAEALGVSASTVWRSWRFARVVLAEILDD